MLGDALSFRALSDYRQNLEARVQRRTAELAMARDQLAETVQRLEVAQEARESDLREPQPRDPDPVDPRHADHRRDPAFDGRCHS